MFVLFFYKRSVEVSLVLLVYDAVEVIVFVSCEEGEEEGGAEGLL